MYEGHHLPPPPGLDSEAGQVRPESNFRGLSDVQKWKGDWMKKGALACIFRAVTLLYSFLAFMLVVTFPDFTTYPDYSYLFSIALVTIIYTAVWVGIKGHELRTGDVIIPHNVTLWLNFCGDQLLALMLLSSASSAASFIRNDEARGEEVLGQGKAAVAMAFLGFFSLESAALITGYNFSIHLSNS
ncbi:hypothetical protein vseg_003401 [Gypsophila vaccaria]